MLLLLAAAVPLAGCELPKQHAPFPSHLRWRGIPSTKVYTAVLRAVHSSGAQINPAGTNTNGQMIETKRESWVWKNNPLFRVDTRIEFNLSILVDGSESDHTDVLINVPWSYVDNNAARLFPRAYRKINARIDPIVEHATRSLGPAIVMSRTTLKR